MLFLVFCCFDVVVFFKPALLVCLDRDTVAYSDRQTFRFNPDVREEDYFSHLPPFSVVWNQHDHYLCGKLSLSGCFFFCFFFFFLLSFDAIPATTSIFDAVGSITIWCSQSSCFLSVISWGWFFNSFFSVNIGDWLIHWLHHCIFCIAFFFISIFLDDLLNRFDNITRKGTKFQ